MTARAERRATKCWGVSWSGPPCKIRAQTFLALLVVRNCARSIYQRITMAADFSDLSRHALLAALRYFPGRKLALYHAHTVPLAVDLPPSAISAASQHIEKRECAEFLAACDLTEEERGRLQVVIEAGPIETAPACHVRKQGAELVVVGSHGSSGLMNIRLGSTSARLLEWLPCDTMVVREPRAAT
jgi:nucleotide-binding universal stress UspA family protein